MIPVKSAAVVGAALGLGALILFPAPALAAWRKLTGKRGGSMPWPDVHPAPRGRIRSGTPAANPADLVDIPARWNRGATKIHRLALTSYVAMMTEAERDLGASMGGAGRIVSARRDAELQARLYAQTLAEVRAANPGASDAEVTRLARQRRAPPGHSEHETGLAVDIDLDGAATLSKNANGRLRQTPLYKWLAANAARFGWFEYAAAGGDSGEAWHWVYNPV